MINLDILAEKIAEKLTMQPRWLKITAASKYASINKKKLVILAENGDITGYQDPDSLRGDWIFDKESLDDYRLRPIQRFSVESSKLIDSILKAG